MALNYEDFAAIIAEVLKLDGPVSADDNFLELGGDSLTAISVARKVEQVTGGEVPLRAFFEETELDGVWRRAADAL